MYVYVRPQRKSIILLGVVFHRITLKPLKCRNNTLNSIKQLSNHLCSTSADAAAVPFSSRRILTSSIRGRKLDIELFMFVSCRRIRTCIHAYVYQLVSNTECVGVIEKMIYLFIGIIYGLDSFSSLLSGCIKYLPVLPYCRLELVMPCAISVTTYYYLVS